MLDFLRRSANSFVVKLLLGLLVVSFAVWGIGDIFRARGSSDAVVTVGNAEITAPQFESEFSRELQRLTQLLHQPIAREQARAMGVDRMLLQRLVNTQIIQEGARDMGLAASDAVVLSEIKKNSEFFDTKGKFDRRIYSAALSRAGLSEAAYVARVRKSLVRQQYLEPITGGTVVPIPLVNAIYKLAAETRTMDVVRIDHSKITGIAQPTNEQLAAYHKDHATSFMAPEYRKLTALVLSADNLGQGIAVTPDELATAYDNRASEFTTPEARTLSQILVKDEASAKRAAELLDQGKSVAEAAKDVGANTSRIKLGIFTQAEAAALSQDIADAAFAPSKGGHSQPVKSPLGWHIFIVDDITPGVVRKLDEVKEQLTQSIRSERALNVLFDTSNKLDDMLGGGQTLEEAAANLGVKTVKLDAVDAQGLAPDGKVAQLPFANAIVAKAFELSEGSDSAMTETKDGKAFFVVRVDSVTAPVLRPLDSVRAQVGIAWMKDQLSAKAAEIAKTVKARMAGGESAQAVAKDLGFDAFTTTPFTRNGNGLKKGALPATLIKEAFSLKPGEVAQALGTDAHTVAKLQTVTESPLDPANPLYIDIAKSTRQDLESDLATQLAGALQQQFPVHVNQAALNNLMN